MSFKARFLYFLHSIRPVYRYEVFLAQRSKSANIQVGKRRIVVRARTRQQAENEAKLAWLDDMDLVTLEPVKRLNKVKRGKA